MRSPRLSSPSRSGTFIFGIQLAWTAIVLFVALPAPAVLAADPSHPAATAADAELQGLAKGIGKQLNSMSATFNRGPAQDVEARVVVLDTQAQPAGADASVAKLRIDLRVTATQLQGGEFVDSDYAVDVELRRDGRLWTCSKAMATRGMVSTKFGPVVDVPREEPFNVTGAVQSALVKMGAAKPGAVVLREAIAKWVGQNNSLDATDPIGDEMGKMVDPFLKQGKDIGILLGPGLMKSGKGTQIGSFGGQLYIVEYTADQSKQAGLQPNNVVQVSGGVSAVRHIPPDAEIGDPDFGPGPLDLGAGLKGQLTVNATRRLPKGDYVIRLNYTAGGRSTSAFCHFFDDWLVETKKQVDFKFAPVRPELAKFSGPLIVFMDICEISGAGNGTDYDIISPTKVMVVDIKPGDGKR